MNIAAPQTNAMIHDALYDLDGELIEGEQGRDFDRAMRLSLEIRRKGVRRRGTTPCGPGQPREVPHRQG